MDEFRERIARIFSFIRSWCDFGLLLVHAAIAIPIVIVVFIILLALPIAYVVFAIQQPLLLALYLFAVFGGVLAYVCLRSKTVGDEEDPHKGRPIISEDKASRRSKSLINPDSKSIRRSK